jgi:hypothetical protein
MKLVNHSVIYVTVKEKANDENSCFFVEGMTGIDDLEKYNC